MRWIWHRLGPKYGPVGIKSTWQRRQQAKREDSIYLNPTQAVVLALVNLLPESRYHVFFDNLFSSSDLFQSLRQRGYGVTGTARMNCGIYKPLVKLKAIDNTAAAKMRFNEMTVIPTKDNQISQSDSFIYEIPTNLSRARSIKSRGKTTSSCCFYRPCLQATKLSLS